MSKTRALSAILATLTLTAVASAAMPPAQAKGGGGGHAAGSSGGYNHFFGRGRGGRGNGNYNQGPTDEQLQAANFQKRSSENPYASVPQHVNVNNYIKTY